MKKTMTIAALVLIASCTNAERLRMSAATGGSIADVQCWSGDTLTYEGSTSSRVYDTDIGGWEFVEASTGRLVEIKGDCVFRYRKR